MHQAARPASRAGTVPSEVVLGGRKVTVARPRVRAAGREVPLPTFQTLAQEDPLNRRVVEQMLVGVATRQYARSLEPVPAGVVSRGTSKSSVSRRFVAKTTAQLRAWQSAPLDGLNLVALLIDGVHIGSARLQRSLVTTNAAESLLSRTRHVKRNVKRWRGGQMMLRWVAAGVLEAVKGFRRLKGHADMPRLAAALRARDQRLGLGVSVENVA